MKYEVGDIVLLLHSNEEGVIKEIMNENMVMVNVEGIEFPVFTDQIDFPYFKRFSDQSKAAKQESTKKVYIDQVPKEKRTPGKNLPDLGVHFSFIPVYQTGSYEDEIDHFRLYLVNKNNEAYNFEYSVRYKTDADFVITNQLPAQTDFYLHNISQEMLNDIVKFQFLFSLVQFNKKMAERLEVPLKLKPKMLFHKIEEMHRLNVPSFSFEVFMNFPAKPVEEYFPLPEKMAAQIKMEGSEPARSIIDLHIDKISDKAAGLSNFEMLQMQLAYFEKYYQLAVIHMQPKLIVIHGIGSGKLRNEIHERLHHKKEVKSFANQYHPNFGFGATEIFFQY